MKLNEIRTCFLDYFAKASHQVVPSSALVPEGDDTLLFTNAGMVQFKDTFLGTITRDYTRAASSQRCVRAGGKHNDLENVGYTARHHTFFEMLGNFSFGDYFKREAIQLAWNFLTQELKLPEERLWITVFETDDEAADIWLNEIGVSKERFSRCGEADNFWQMGDTGPCGPCTEIFYDHGPEIPGGPPGSETADLDRYIEIWNLVFMQYERTATGELLPLPKPSVDTGMGLERLAAVLQNVHSNYEIDLFQSLIASAKQLFKDGQVTTHALQVIADHIRSSAFLILDGVQPSNEGRGYVLRRIIRRAVRHGYQQGANAPFFHQLAAPLATLMGEAYPALAESVERITQIIQREETLFYATLANGMQEFNEALKAVSGQTFPGDVAFKLYDTFGFPLDLTEDMAKHNDLVVDVAAFEVCMAEQRAKARAANQFSQSQNMKLTGLSSTQFVGYSELSTSATTLAVFDEGGERVSTLEPGQIGYVVLDKTPFYAESGGQVGDRGYLNLSDGFFEVRDTQKQSGIFVHSGLMQACAVSEGAAVQAVVTDDVRTAVARHHSATHLLHAALRQVLGTHVEQKGSLVAPDRLRFDFTHSAPVTKDELTAIEALVNQHVLMNSPVTVETMTLEAAKSAGAMALFGEKYADDVRTLKMGGDFSFELCGGTHVSATGEIGPVVIVSESGVASGVRRIEAFAGESAMKQLQDSANQLHMAAKVLKSEPQQLLTRLSGLLEENKALKDELGQLKLKLAKGGDTPLSQQVESIAGHQLLIKSVEIADGKALRGLMDDLKNQLQSGLIFLGAVNGDKVSLIAGVTKDLSHTFNARDWVNAAAKEVSGKGGGRNDLAQAGGTHAPGFPAAMAAARDWVVNQLQQ